MSAGSSAGAERAALLEDHPRRLHADPAAVVPRPPGSPRSTEIALAVGRERGIAMDDRVVVIAPVPRALRPGPRGWGPERDRLLVSSTARCHRVPAPSDRPRRSGARRTPCRRSRPARSGSSGHARSASPVTAAELVMGDKLGHLLGAPSGDHPVIHEAYLRVRTALDVHWRGSRSTRSRIQRVPETGTRPVRRSPPRSRLRRETPSARALGQAVPHVDAAAAPAPRALPRRPPHHRRLLDRPLLVGRASPVEAGRQTA